MAWTIRAVLFDAPSVAGDVLVAVVLDGANEVILGVSTSGEQLWERPIASRSAAPFRSTWLLHEGLLYVIEDDPAPPFDSFLVAVSPESGEELARSGPISFGPAVSICSLDGETDVVCTVSDLEYLVFEPTTLAVTYEQELSGDSSGRYLALALGDDPEEQLNVYRDRFEYLRDGASLWSTSITDALENPSLASDGACCIYAFELPVDLRDPAFGLNTVTNIVFGSLSGPEQITTEDQSLFQYSLTGVTVGLDRDSGGRRWLRPGNRTSCGAWFTGPTSENGLIDDNVPLACVVEGSGTFVAGEPDEITLNARTTFLRFNPADGQSLWEIDLGDVAGLRADRLNQTPAQAVDPAEILVETASGVLVVNIETGATRQPAEAEVFLCQSRSLLRNTTRSAGGFLTFPCGADFEPIASDDMRSIPEEFLGQGVRLGDVVVYATDGGLIAYKSPNSAQG